MRVSVIAPVKNEAQFIGYSIMAAFPHVEEFVYAIAPSSDDGTIDLLRHIAKNYGKVRLLIQNKYDFNPHDMKAYNESFDDCIQQARGDAVMFLHPDMIITKWTDLEQGPLAWWVKVTSYARDLTTVITKGRTDKWKNIHAKKFGLVYRGGYGSQNEDFYHSDITGTSWRHFGTDFQKYPFSVASSGIELNHYCELKPYKRRLEKMKLCLKTQYPEAPDDWIEKFAVQHPRVTLEQSGTRFGDFEFTETDRMVPDVFEKHKSEFDAIVRQEELVNG